MSEIYGIFSEKDGVETLHNVEEDGRAALVWMGKYIAFRSFGDVPTHIICKVLDLIDRYATVKDFAKQVRVEDVYYHVRMLTPEEMNYIASQED